MLFLVLEQEAAGLSPRGDGLAGSGSASEVGLDQQQVLERFVGFTMTL